MWPGVAISILLLASYAIPIVAPGAFLYALIGGVVAALLMVLWWVFFSRAPWSERAGAVMLMAIGLAVTSRFLDVSIATAGQGALFYIHAIRLLGLALFVWALLSRDLSVGARWSSMIATIVIACGLWTLLRSGGITGDGQSELAWRWSETPEERLLAEVEDVPAAPPAAHIEADWPGFRGPGRDSVLPGVRIETDWEKAAPVELWRRPVGPGWSSFAVGGGFLYTQEQRGDDEIVACYDATTGEPVWQHADPARFYESNGGAGPRATPTLLDGRVYSFGATGIANVLDAADGSLVWSRDVAADSDTKVPGWGFASSPLVVDDVVIIAAAGTLVGYDRATGEPRWMGSKGGDGYSSPHRLTIDGVEQVLLQNGTGAISVAPDDGALLWEHPWPGFRIVQPTLIAGGDLLVTSANDGGGLGTRRIAVTRGPGGWNVEQRWTSNRLKPYFNDFVVHDGHAFGFDGRILTCIDLDEGERQWKGGRYGHGQLVLLADQDVLLVLSEDGEIALVAATPDRFTEIARVTAIDGKTWNHPVLVGDVLYVRNGQEMAAFRLSLARL
jgi:outer membrane protein assembly factor BamB